MHIVVWKREIMLWYVSGLSNAGAYEQMSAVASWLLGPMSCNACAVACRGFHHEEEDSACLEENEDGGERQRAR
jgi:hypothetical protein